MGVILEFKPRETSSTPDEVAVFDEGHTAQIIFFPGVRIERLSDEAFEQRRRMKQGL